MKAARLSQTLPLFGVLLAAPSIAEAATTYYVGPDGSASAAGTSRDAPTTMSAVPAKLAAGDTVIFLDGVYTKQTMELTKSGTADAPITFRADDGAVPVIRGNGVGENQGAIGAEADVAYLVFEGLWFEEWGSGGIEIDWDFKGCHDITIRHCVADHNGRNGFAPYNSTNVLVEYNIGSRNGYRDDSWSSNFNLWGNKGKVVVRGNVAFHGIDTSSNKSDGNGFILDLTLDKAQALFENNIAFGNGGACIAITDSGGATLVGNSCYNNAKDTQTNDFMLVNTCRGLVTEGEIDVGNKGWTFSGLSMRNNVLVGNIKTVSSCGSSNYTSTNDARGVAKTVFENADEGDLRPKAGSAIVDKVDHTGTFETDIGFDPKCIKRETDSAKKFRDWWTHGPDLEYIKKIGGIKKCWSPRTRPQGSKQEQGAYELVSSGCTTAAACDDKDPCTDDTCKPDGECGHAPIAGCGSTGPGADAGPVGDSGSGTEGGSAGAGGQSGGSGGKGDVGRGGSDGGVAGKGQAGSGKAGGGQAGRSDVGKGGGEPKGGTGGATGTGGKDPGTAGSNATGGQGGKTQAGGAGGSSDPDDAPTNLEQKQGCGCTLPTQQPRAGLSILALLGLASALRLRKRSS